MEINFVAVADAADVDRLAARLALAWVSYGPPCGRDGTPGIRFVDPATGATLAFEGPEE